MSKPGNAWRRISGKITGRPTNFSWVLEDALAGSGLPTTQSEVEWLRETGVKSIISMTEDPLPAEWIEKMGYLHVPTPDLTAPTLAGIKRAVDFVRQSMRSGEPVVVHCAAGLGRAGTILACYLVRYEGYTAREAIRHVRDLRPGSIQSESQEMAISMYEKHLG